MSEINIIQILDKFYIHRPSKRDSDLNDGHYDFYMCKVKTRLEFDPITWRTMESPGIGVTFYSFTSENKAEQFISEYLKNKGKKIVKTIIYS